MDKYKFEALKDVKRGIIVDTDIGPDCDDVGALVVLYTLAKKYQVPVLGVLNCTSNKYGTGEIDIVSRYCGWDNVEIGACTREGFMCDESTMYYNKSIAETFGTEYEPIGSKRPKDALKMYREILSKAKDKSIIIVTIGMLNNIADLLESGPDEISDKDGRTLIEEKVYAFVTMAGRTEVKTRECNIICDPDAAEIFINKVPVPVIYSGFEIGESIKSGFGKEPPANADKDPVYLSYRKYILDRGRRDDCYKSSFDLTAVQFAFEGEGEYYTLQGPGYMELDRANNDKTIFVKDDSKNCYYMEKACDGEIIGKLFSDMLLDAGK